MPRQKLVLANLSPDGPRTLLVTHRLGHQQSRQRVLRRGETLDFHPDPLHPTQLTVEVVEQAPSAEGAPQGELSFRLEDDSLSAPPPKSEGGEGESGRWESVPYPGKKPPT